MSTPAEVPCGICGKPTSYTSTKRCNRCWEVEYRLEGYLEHMAGREHVRQLLAKAEEATP
jgi:hypothetical protein